MATVHTDYLFNVFDPDKFRKTVDETIQAAECMMRQTPFDAIAFTGTSGSALAYILAHWLDIPMVCVRKKLDGSHYPEHLGLLEGYLYFTKYIIVDDFISSGATVDRILDEIGKKINAECVGIITYSRTTDGKYKNIPVLGVRDRKAPSYKSIVADFANVNVSE